MKVYRFEAPDNHKMGIYGIGGDNTLAYRYTARPLVAKDYEDYCVNPFSDEKLAHCDIVHGGMTREEFEDVKNNPLSLMFCGDDREIDRNWICGFASIESMLHWFPPENLDRMTSEVSDQVVLAVYEVDEKWVRIGDKQCLFNLKYAKFLDSYQPNHFNEEAKQEA